MNSLRDQLQSVYDQRGTLTPSILVEEARDPKHPLHARFEWDDNVAGEAWRKHQAHELITSVKIVYKRAEGDQRERTVRAFHAIPTDQGYVYKPADEVVHDEFTALLLLSEMERAWNELKRRYEHFEEFWQMVRSQAEQAA